jgi:hypothetical protein
MSEKGPGGPPEAEDDGFVLLEGWMFGALMYPPAIDRVREFPPANDNEA